MEQTNSVRSKRSDPPISDALAHPPEAGASSESNPTGYCFERSKRRSIALRGAREAAGGVLQLSRSSVGA
jgi:hypothetical protein